VAVPRGVRAGLVALVLVAGAPVPVAVAGPPVTGPEAHKADVDRQRHQLADGYDETLAAEADQVAAFERSRARSAELGRQLVTLDRSVTGAQRSLQDATARAATARARVQRASRAQRAAQVELDRRRAALRSMAVSSYVWFGERGRVHSAVPAGPGAEGDVQVQVLSQFYAGYLDDVQGDRVHDVESEQARISHLRRDAARADTKAEAARRSVARRRDALVRARDAQAAAKQDADREVTAQRALVAEVRARRVQDEQQLDELAAESESVGALLRARSEAAGAAARVSAPAARPAAGASSRVPTPAARRPTAFLPSPPPARPGPPVTRPRSQPPVVPATRPPSRSTSVPDPATTNNAGAGAPPRIAVRLSFPLPGYPIVSTYGWRIHPILGVRKLHEGIDIYAPTGTPIHAAAAGVVVWAGPRNGYGNAVVIDHGSGVATLYAHQSVIGAAVGQRVASGQVIGYVGQTGLAAGPHCHFEVRVNGHTYDPLAYVHP